MHTFQNGIIFTVTFQYELNNVREIFSTVLRFEMGGIDVSILLPDTWDYSGRQSTRA